MTRDQQEVLPLTFSTCKAAQLEAAEDTQQAIAGRPVDALKLAPAGRAKFGAFNKYHEKQVVKKIEHSSRFL